MKQEKKDAQIKEPIVQIDNVPDWIRKQVHIGANPDKYKKSERLSGHANEILNKYKSKSDASLISHTSYDSCSGSETTCPKDLHKYKNALDYESLLTNLPNPSLALEKAVVEIALVKSGKLIELVNDDPLVKKHLIMNNTIHVVLISLDKLALFKQLQETELIPLTLSSLAICFQTSILCNNEPFFRLFDEIMKMENIKPSAIVLDYAIICKKNHLTPAMAQCLLHSKIKQGFVDNIGTIVKLSVQSKNKDLLTWISKQPVLQKRYETELDCTDMHKHYSAGDSEYYEFLKNLGFTAGDICSIPGTVLVSNHLAFAKTLSKDGTYIDRNTTMSNFANSVRVTWASPKGKISLEIIIWLIVAIIVVFVMIVLMLITSARCKRRRVVIVDK